MSCGDGNWLKTVATELTGVKLAQRADNCYEQAARGAQAAVDPPPPSASHLPSASVTHLKAQKGTIRKNTRLFSLRAGVKLSGALVLQEKRWTTHASTPGGVT